MSLPMSSVCPTKPFTCACSIQGAGLLHPITMPVDLHQKATLAASLMACNLPVSSCCSLSSTMDTILRRSTGAGGSFAVMIMA